MINKNITLLIILDIKNKEKQKMTTQTFNTPENMVTYADVKNGSKSEANYLIGYVLRKLCITPKYNGYKYLKHSIMLCLKNPLYLDKNVTKMLYPEVAKKFNTSAVAIERGIRNVIQESSAICDDDVKFEYLGEIQDNYTNTEFISYIVELLEMNRIDT